LRGKKKAMQRIEIIQVDPEQIQRIVSDAVKHHFEDLKKDFQPKQPNRYLTRAEVAKMLRIDLSTLHLWTKQGKLVSYGIGNRVYYKQDEVEDALKQLNGIIKTKEGAR
jgi:excisionase family DNA binding protein